MTMEPHYKCNFCKAVTTDESRMVGVVARPTGEFAAYEIRDPDRCFTFHLCKVCHRALWYLYSRLPEPPALDE